MRRLFRSLVLTALLALPMLLLAGTARANIMITPIYVIMDERARSAEVTLINTSDEMGIYRVEWSYTRQKTDGSYENLAALPEGQIDPVSFMRFSPRQVTLLPRGKQKVRIQLRRPENLPDGEYRIHLSFVRQPNNENNVKAQPRNSGLALQLKVFMGISIPIVVRQGKYDAHASIVDAAFEQPKRKAGERAAPMPELRVNVKRTGIHGTYGRLRVFWDRGGDDQQQVGLLNNFSIYADNPERVAHIPLTVSALPSGSLRIVYEGDGPQRGKIFAEQVVKIGG